MCCLKRSILWSAVLIFTIFVAIISIREAHATCLGEDCRGKSASAEGCSYKSYPAASNIGWGKYGRIDLWVYYSPYCESNWSRANLSSPANGANYFVVKAAENAYPYYSELVNKWGPFPSNRVTEAVTKMVNGQQVPVWGHAGVTRYGNWNYDPFVSAYAP